MKITCEQCQANYTIADEKVHGRTVRIRCRKCSSDIVVRGALGSAAAAEGDQIFQVSVSESDERSMSLAEVVAALASGLIQIDSYVWADGFPDWKPIHEVDAIMSRVPEPESESLALTEAAPEVAPESIGKDRLSKAPPAKEPVAPAAAPQALTPEPRAAVMKRDDGRGTRDLFGNPVEVEAAPKSIDLRELTAPSPTTDGLTTGQRGENSVLFSLATLGPSLEAGKTPPPPSADSVTSGAGGGGGEDDGIIDIKALLPQNAEPRAIAPAVPVALFGPPVLEPQALSTPPEQAAAGGRSKLVIIGGVAAAAIIGLAGAFWAQSNKAAEGPAPAIMPSAAPVETVAPTPPPAPPPPPPATTTEPAPEPPAAAKPAPKAPSHAAPAQKPAAQAAPAAAATPAKPAKPAKSGPCKCAGDDLMCQIRCSAGQK